MVVIMADLVTVVGGSGDLGTILRWVAIMTTIILGFLRTQRGVSTVSKKVAAGPVEQPIDQQIAILSRDMQIRMSRLEGAFMLHQRDHLSGAPQVKRRSGG